MYKSTPFRPPNPTHALTKHLTFTTNYLSHSASSIAISSFTFIDQHLAQNHPPTMSDTQIPMFTSTSVPSLPTHTSTPSTRTFRERCGFTLFVSFAPAFPHIPAKEHVGPTAGNLPRRKRSSVSLDLPDPVPAADANARRVESSVWIAGYRNRHARR